MHLPAVSQPFDGPDLLIPQGGCEDQAGIDGQAVNVHRAGTAFSLTAPLLGAGQSQIFP